MPIFIDDTEEKSGVPGYLRKFNADIKVQRIQSGDYIIGDIAIERKCLPDLLLSVRPNVSNPGHTIWNQLKVMKNTYKQPILLIEGHINWNDALENGIITTILIFWKYQMWNTWDQEESAKFIMSMYEKYGAGKSGVPPPAAVRKAKTVNDIMMEMLQCFEHVGPVLAKRILIEISHDNFVNMGVLEFHQSLKNIKGLGKETREKIVQVFKGLPK